VSDASSLSERIMPILRHLINGSRYYSIPGHKQFFPSVTTVLKIINKPGLHAWQQRVTLEAVKEALKVRPKQLLNVEQERKWLEEVISNASMQANKIRTDAADLGTRAHAFIDDNLMRDKMCEEVSEELKPIVQGFETWRKQTDLFFVRKDTVVFSTEMKYAGALDALARKISTKGLVILDWKTSNRFSHDYAYQVAAYAKALEEMTGEPVEEGWAVRFDKHKPIFEVRRVRDLDDSFEVFKYALLLWRATQQDPWTTVESSSIYPDLQ